MELNKLIFPAPKSTYNKVSIALLPNTELLYIPSGQQMSCFTCNGPQARMVPVLLVKCQKIQGGCPNYVLFFHSNSEDIYHCYEYLRPFMNNLNVNLILVEYPGYGIYENASSTADIISEDAVAVYEYFLKKRRITQEQIVIMSRSMGCGPACLLASKYSPAGLIAISGYSRLRDVAQHLVGSVLAKLIQDRFNNIDIIKDVKCPMLVIHGLKDELIPFEQSKMLLSTSKAKVKQYHFSELMQHNEFDIFEDIVLPTEQFFRKISFIVRDKQGEREQFQKLISLNRFPESVQNMI